MFNPDGVVLDKCSRGAEQDDATIRRAIHQVVANDSRTTADADTIGPLLKNIRATWANVVVLNDDVIAKKATLGDVEARPATWIIRVHVFDQLIRIWTAHLYICSAQGRRSTGTGSIDLRMM
jgi:hypothetical protein